MLSKVLLVAASRTLLDKVDIVLSHTVVFDEVLAPPDKISPLIRGFGDESYSGSWLPSGGASGYSRGSVRLSITLISQQSQGLVDCSLQPQLHGFSCLANQGFQSRLSR